jgi:hypothetical protein
MADTNEPRRSKHWVGSQRKGQWWSDHVQHINGLHINNLSLLNICATLCGCPAAGSRPPSDARMSGCLCGGAEMGC